MKYTSDSKAKADKNPDTRSYIIPSAAYTPPCIYIQLGSIRGAFFRESAAAPHISPLVLLRRGKAEIREFIKVRAREQEEVSTSLPSYKEDPSLKFRPLVRCGSTPPSSFLSPFTFLPCIFSRRSRELAIALPLWSRCQLIRLAPSFHSLAHALELWNVIILFIWRRAFHVRFTGEGARWSRCCYWYVMWSGGCKHFCSCILFYASGERVR